MPVLHLSDGHAGEGFVDSMFGVEQTMTGMRLSAIAKRYALQLRGRDREVVSMGTLTNSSMHRGQMLTYLASEQWLEAFATSGIAACVTSEQLAARLPDDAAALVTDANPAEVFYTVFAHSVEEGQWTAQQGAIAPTATVAPSAVVHPGVIIGAHSTVMENAVVLPKTTIGAHVTIKPNATIGGDGFQIAAVDGRRRVIPHAGGVEIGDGAFIGSQTCIDRGLFGEATTVGAGAMVDNLVHVAHSVVVGREASVIACSEISGSARIGEGAWLGPNTSVNPGVEIGDHAYLGTGSVVVRNIGRHVLAYGSPARQAGWACRCHAKLPAPDAEGHTSCSACGALVILPSGESVE